MAHSSLVRMADPEHRGESVSRRTRFNNGFANDQIICVQIGIVLCIGHGRAAEFYRTSGRLSRNELQNGHAFGRLFTGRIRATSLAFFGEILMYLEYDLISIVYFWV